MPLRNVRALRSSRRRPALVAAVAVLAGGPVLFGTVRAAIPDGAGKINACYSMSGGSLRVIDTAQVPASCRADENSLNWNQTGPPGKDGTNGINGKDGKDGKDGVSGYSRNFVDVNLPPNQGTVAEAPCLTLGAQPLGGGFDLHGPVDVKNLQIRASYPTVGKWVVFVFNSSATTKGTVKVAVVCANI